MNQRLQDLIFLADRTESQPVVALFPFQHHVQLNKKA